MNESLRETWLPPIKISNLNHSYWDGSHDYWPHAIRERHACYTYTFMHTYLLNIQISDSKETIMVWYKNRNVQLPRLKNDSPQTSYKYPRHKIASHYGQSFKLCTRSHKLFLQHLQIWGKTFPFWLEWRRPLRLGPNLVFFSLFVFTVLGFHSQS